MALLTDGQEWGFYLPTERGTYEDRRVYKLDLLERTTEECCQVLIRYLAHDRVKRQEAIADARKDYESASRERIAADTLVSAWQKLVEEPDGLLIDILTEKTQALWLQAHTRTRGSISGHDGPAPAYPGGGR